MSGKGKRKKVSDKAAYGKYGNASRLASWKPKKIGPPKAPAKKNTKAASAIKTPATVKELKVAIRKHNSTICVKLAGNKTALLNKMGKAAIPIPAHQPTKKKGTNMYSEFVAANKKKRQDAKNAKAAQSTPSATRIKAAKARHAAAMARIKAANGKREESWNATVKEVTRIAEKANVPGTLNKN